MSGVVKVRDITEVYRDIDARDLVIEVHAIATKHQVSVAEMWGPRRIQGIPEARHELWSLLRDRGWSWPRISTFASKDQQTIRNGVRAHLRRVIGGRAA